MNEEMLMITKIKHNDSSITLKLDGKIEGMYLQELEGICKCHLSDQSAILTLDFSGVTFIDERGLEMLLKMRDRNLKIVKCTPFIKTLLSGLAD